MNKLDKLSANIGMANVCSVPLDFIILRGQGIKVQSLVSKECNIENYILRELEKSSNSSYEGAIVFLKRYVFRRSRCCFRLCFFISIIYDC